MVLRGRFDISKRQNFMSALRTIVGNDAVKEIEVNFSGVDYIDSSACGMLLLLKEKTTKAGKSIFLSGMQGDVNTVFRILNFNSIFSII